MLRLRARGEFLKIVTLLILAFLVYSHVDELPARYTLLLLKKKHIIDLALLKPLVLGCSLILVTLALYLALLMKTTVLDLGKVNLTRSHGIFFRSDDALNITSIQDVRKERTLLDMLLGISKIIIFSKDPTDPKLKIKGLKKSDADLFYEHIILYSNKNLVEYVQGQSERRKFNKKQNRKSDSSYKGLIDDPEDET